MFSRFSSPVIRRILRLGGLSSDAEAEVLVLSHELAVLDRIDLGVSLTHHRLDLGSPEKRFSCTAVSGGANR